ncbi:MAG: hypothetical protein ACJAS4_000660 [Bacteriovoracaceae bacterium]|jgi:hypothetical protein
MATIEVNSHKITINERNYLNLKSLIPKLQKEFPIGQFKLDRFKINGESIDINSEDPKLIRPIEQSDFIEISFNSSNQLLSDILIDLAGLTDKILLKITQTADEFKLENDDIAMVQLSTVIDAVDLFIKTINHACNSILDREEIEGFLPIKELQIHLLSVIKAIHSAHQKEDHIMLTDLLEYELKDNLTQWKILILPTLKQEVLKTY